MKTVGELIQSLPIWVSPEHPAVAAIVLMRGTHTHVLPVLRGGALVGVVTSTDLLGVEPQTPVADVMSPPALTVPEETLVRDGAAAMAEAGVPYLPVVTDGALKGLLTHGDVLPELGRSYDPLTKLPWTDSLVEWSIERFRQGNELAVLFLDLDGFGQFNKQFGHVVGDEVLRAASHVFTETLDPQTDFLCRYGGDEFCIASLRSANDAARLGARLSRLVNEIDLPSIGGSRLSVSVGQSGGMRTREREQTHFAATINNLINLASRDCIRNKPTSSRQAADQPAARALERPRLRLGEVEVAEVEGEVTVRVSLHVGAAARAQAEESGAEHLSSVATARAKAGDVGAERLVADATAAALRSFLPAGAEIELESLSTLDAPDGRTVVTAIAAMRLLGDRRPLVGSALQDATDPRAAARAVLAATNRFMEGLLFSDAAAQTSR